MPAPQGHGRDNPPIEPGWVLVLIGLAVVATAILGLGL
jgi:hypothetical protein